MMTRVWIPALAAIVLAAGFLAGAGCGSQEEGDVPPASAAVYAQDGSLIAKATQPANKPNLIVLVLDTLRRDAVAHPGESGGSMPYLAALAAESVAFTNTSSVSPWTVPALTTMLTGLYPGEHGCDYPLGIPRLAPSITTYAEALRKGYGYDTQAFSGGPWFRSADHSILQGFAGGSVEKGWNLGGTKKEVGAWAQARDKSQPFFLLLHSFDPHDPYGEEDHPYPDVPGRWNELGFRERVAKYDATDVTEPWQWTEAFLTDRVARWKLAKLHGGKFIETVTRYAVLGYAESPRPQVAARIRDAYIEGLRWVDRITQEAIAELEAQGLMENTLLVVTSDHGEAFGEHGLLGHGRQLYDELLRVPLIFRGPGPFAQPKQVTANVGLIDVLPTFFDWAGFAQIPGAHGRSLLPVLRGDEQGHPVIAQERLGRDNTGANMKQLLYSVRSERWKFIITYDITGGRITESVFDLASDPEERKDIAAAWLAADAPRDPAFCRAVETIRDWAWREVEDRRALAGTIYGGDSHVPGASRPKPLTAK